MAFGRLLKGFGQVSWLRSAGQGCCAVPAQEELSENVAGSLWAGRTPVTRATAQLG